MLLPYDIVVNEILPKLPAKSLIRFKCVNKLFQTLITSQEFIDIHLRRSSTHLNRILILKKNYCLYCLDLDSLINNVPKPKLLPGSTNHGFVGSCNGIICFMNHCALAGEELVFLNPSTGMFKSGIPIPSMNFFSFGFGYDSTTNDYKVVSLDSEDEDDDEDYHRGGNHNDYLYCFAILRVYSMRTNSWKFIERNLTREYSRSGPCAIIDSHLVHWAFSGKSPRRVRCFDLRTEQWAPDDVPVPDEYDHFDKLKVINGCLSFFTEDNIHCYVWIMKEYGVKESWVKFLISDTSPYCGMRFGHRIIYVDNFVSAFRKETGKDEILVSGRNQEERIAYEDGSTHCWYDISHQTFDEMKQIPPKFEVVATSIGSLVNIF